MKKLYLTIAALLLPIAGHGIMAMFGNEDARFFLRWSMLLIVLIASGVGVLILKGLDALRKKHDITEDLLFFTVLNSLIQWMMPAVQFVHIIIVELILAGAVLSSVLAWIQQKINPLEKENE